MPNAENAILDPFSAMAPTEAIMVAVCGLVVVFLMLAILALVIRINSKLVSLLEGRKEEPAPAPVAKHAPAAPAPAPADSAPAHNLAPADLLYWKRPCALVAEACGLTPRETEVLEQLAQGRDLAFMEERFTISRNTIKMHTKRVYAKLGVHSKQELIDLVDSVRERERFAEGDR